MVLRDVVKDNPGEEVFLLGNEAIARGFIEGRLRFGAAYPGTPSSEITDTLARACAELRGRYDFFFEYSVNEKVAFEAAAGASMAGKRAVAIMKHVGVNVAADALFSFAYIGAKGGFVLVSADDPSAHSSQNEQDNRWYGKSAYVPVIEPSTIQEAHELSRESFEISEMLGLPVIFRTVTRLSHASGIIKLGEIPDEPFTKVSFEKDPSEFVLIPAHARTGKIKLLEKMEKAREFANKSDYNRIMEGDSDVGILTGGLGYVYALEALKYLDLDAWVMKVTTMNPLPDEKISDFISQIDRLVVVEELDPYLELHVKAIAKDVNPDLEIHGKFTGDFPMEYEYTVDVVEKGIASSLGMAPKVDFEEIRNRANEAKKILPPRPPILCPGCPHTASFYAIKQATGDSALYPSDIGCYTLGVNPPLSTVDITLCMGGGVGTANGLSYVVKDDIVVTVGDSTFFHACIPSLIDAVYNNNKFVLVVLDNRTTAMTGHQPHPGTGERACGEIGKFIPIEDVARSIGVDFVEVVNPYNLRKMTEVMERALAHDRVAVVVARRACAILWNRERKQKGIKIKPFTVTEDCTRCLRCVTSFTCPALVLVGDQVTIDETLCAGCGVCFQVCPYGAIVSKDVAEKEVS